MQLTTFPFGILLAFILQSGEVNPIVQLFSSSQTYQSLQNLSSRVLDPVRRSEFVLSVKDTGAVGNGETDDTSAIQTAIDNVYKAGGGIVFFPAGIYQVKISPLTDHAITVRSGITLQGESNQESVIKIAEKQGNYDSILAGENPDSNLSDFAIYDITIDGNGPKNPVGKLDFTARNSGRYSLRIYVGSRIAVKQSRFINQSNVNVITINGNIAPFNVAISDVLIGDNIFELIGGGEIDYDHSSIYVHGKRVKIINNRFSSMSGSGTRGARAAIEIHGDEQFVENNFIEGFTNGINVTGVASSSNHQIITENVIQGAHTGITIWSYFSDGNFVQPALKECIISNNRISLNVDAWRDLWGDSPAAGIVLDPNSNAPVENLQILNNEITFANYLKPGRATDNLANGIRLWRINSPDIISQSVKLMNNRIENPLAAGIFVSMRIKEGEISHNTILKPGEIKGAFNDAYRAAIIASGDFENFEINNNLVIEN